MCDFADFEVSSRALANDSETIDSAQRLTTEYTDEGKTFKNLGFGSGSKNILCIFTDLQGFAETYIKSQLSDVTLLSKTFLVPSDPVDEDEFRRGKHLVLSVYKLKQALFVIFGSKFEIGHSFVQEIINGELNVLLLQSSCTYIFSSQPVATFRNNYCPRLNYFLKSTSFKDKSELQRLVILPVPNIISGFSAAVLTHCEKEERPCLQIINYLDNNDTTDLPFLDYIQSSPVLKSVFTFDMPAIAKLNRAKADTSYLFT